MMVSDEILNEISLHGKFGPSSLSTDYTRSESTIQQISFNLYCQLGFALQQASKVIACGLPEHCLKKSWSANTAFWYSFDCRRDKSSFLASELIFCKLSNLFNSFSLFVGYYASITSSSKHSSAVILSWAVRSKNNSTDCCGFRACIS